MPCVSQVELGADTVSGPVRVSQFGGAGDSILLDALPTAGGTDDNFGPTTLTQLGGAGDTVTIGAHAQSVSITQGDGNNDVITVNPLVLTNVTGPGLVTVQGNGNLDITNISHVTSPIGTGTLALQLVPAPTSLANISVTQGNGNQDTATVSTSTIFGNITVTQGDGGPSVTTGTVGDTITAAGDTLSQNPYVNGSISLTQDLSGPSSGTLGFFDRATVTGFMALGNAGAARLAATSPSPRASATTIRPR